MEKTRLSSKGQIVLPKSVRDAHRWVAGTELVVEPTADGVMLRPTKPFAASRLEDVVGCLRYMGKPKTIEEMDEAIDSELGDRRDRGRY